MVANDWHAWRSERDAVMEELYKYGYTEGVTVTVPTVLIREAERSFKESIIYMKLLEAFTQDAETRYLDLLREARSQGLPLEVPKPLGGGTHQGAGRAS